MPRVLPTQAVALIDRILPWVATQPWPTQAQQTLNYSHAGSIQIIVDIVDEIPAELIALEGDQYASFASGLAFLKHALSAWPILGGTYVVEITPGFQRSPLVLIREGLLKCPDEAPTAGTADLAFIPDNDLREALRIDISTSHSALLNGEWKPSTVMAGSVTEALLLWTLPAKKTSAEIQNSVATLRPSNPKFNWRAASDLESWVLYQLIEVGADLNVISKNTAEQCRIAKDFRNLIHPGRAQRLALACTRGTAHSAIAAMELVIDDLK